MADEPKCDVCGQAIGPGAGRKLERLDMKAEVDVHEVCYLRMALKEAREQAGRLTGIVAGVIEVLGGRLRLHVRDIQLGVRRGPVTCTPEPGGFVTVTIGEPARVDLAPVIEMPAAPGGPVTP